MGLPGNDHVLVSSLIFAGGGRSEAGDEGPPPRGWYGENRDILRRCAVAEVEAWGREQKVCTKDFGTVISQEMSFHRQWRLMT